MRSPRATAELPVCKKRKVWLMSHFLGLLSFCTSCKMSAKEENYEVFARCGFNTSILRVELWRKFLLIVLIVFCNLGYPESWGRKCHCWIFLPTWIPAVNQEESVSEPNRQPHYVLCWLWAVDKTDLESQLFWKRNFVVFHNSGYRFTAFSIWGTSVRWEFFKFVDSFILWENSFRWMVLPQILSCLKPNWHFSLDSFNPAVLMHQKKFPSKVCGISGCIFDIASTRTMIVER